MVLSLTYVTMYQSRNEQNAHIENTTSYRTISLNFSSFPRKPCIVAYNTTAPIDLRLQLPRILSHLSKDRSLAYLIKKCSTLASPKSVVIVSR